MDPLTSSYPWYTPYQFAGNRPIWAVDLDGQEDLNYNWSRNLNESNGPTVSTEHMINITRFALSVERGPEKNAAYKYFLVPTIPLSGERTERGLTRTQRWAINKARSANGTNNILANRLFTHFIQGGGETYVLNESEQKMVKPFPFSPSGTKFPILSSNSGTYDVSFNEKIKNKNEVSKKKLLSELSKLKVGESNDGFVSRITGGAERNGTLGEFTIIFEGKLTKTSTTTYHINGTYTFEDGYDFDVRFFDVSGLRSTGGLFGDLGGEGKVRKVRAFQIVTGNGDDFNVTTEKIKYDKEFFIPK